MTRCGFYLYTVLVLGQFRLMSIRSNSRIDLYINPLFLSIEREKINLEKKGRNLYLNFF